VPNAAQVISRLARLTPQTSSVVSGAALELQGNTLQACTETIDIVSQALQPVTNLPRGVDWYQFLNVCPKNATMCTLTLVQEELLEDCACQTTALERCSGKIHC
jgi:hypothetical protein